jgi:hypothetical protein
VLSAQRYITEHVAEAVGLASEQSGPVSDLRKSIWSRS